MVLTQIRISVELREKAKVAAAQERMTLQAWVDRTVGAALKAK